MLKRLAAQDRKLGAARASVRTGNRMLALVQ
jgi:hypothetical protein